MQIIVLMSGFGERFRRAIYALAKPISDADGKVMIGYVWFQKPGMDLLTSSSQDPLLTLEERLDVVGYLDDIAICVNNLRKWCQITILRAIALSSVSHSSAKHDSAATQAILSRILLAQRRFDRDQER